MRKNAASQVVVGQLVNKTDGSAVTSGTTTCYVLGDGGTQAAGSVGSGACTHEGNGVWSYFPAQAETNYDHVAFTFVNTSAVTATVQIYTSFPQTGDNYARLGAPAGASVSADVAAIKSDTGTTLTDATAIKAKTDSLTFTVAGMVDSNVVDWKGSTAPAMTGDAYARLGAPAGASVSADIAAVKSDTGTVLTDVNTGAGAIYTRIGAPAGASVSADVAAVKSELDAVKAKTDNLPASPAATGDAMTLTSAYDFAKGTVAMTEAYAADGAAITPSQALHMIWSLLAERSISSTTLTAKKLDGTTTSMTFTLDDATNPSSQTRAT